MANYILKRLAMGVLTLFVLATLTFFLMKLIPGSPFGPMTNQLSAAQITRLNETYHLDKSIPQQYLIYLKNALRGDFGDSIVRKGTSVASIIQSCLPVTMGLGAVAFVFSLVAGITLGIVAALSKKAWVNNAVMIFATIGVSVPSFLFAMLLMVLFCVQLRIFPIIGLKTPLHYVLPAFSLSLYPISMISRLVRSSMTEVMSKDYMVLARSKGTPKVRSIIKHGLKNALIPVITYCGPLLAYLMTGSFVIETLFSVPGIGAEFVTSVSNRDYTMIMALTVLFGAMIIIVNLLSDLLTAVIDPRIKLDGKKTV